MSHDCSFMMIIVVEKKNKVNFNLKNSSNITSFIDMETHLIEFTQMK